MRAMAACLEDGGYDSLPSMNHILAGHLGNMEVDVPEEKEETMDTATQQPWLYQPDVKHVSCCRGWAVDVSGRLMQEELKVTDNGVGPIPALLHPAWSRNVDPALASCPHSVVDVNTEWQFRWRRKGMLREPFMCQCLSVCTHLVQEEGDMLA